MAYYKNRGRMLKHRAIKRAVAGKRYNKKHLSMRVSSKVKKYVKRAIHANIENKRAISDNSYTVGSIANSTILNARPLTPAAGFLSIVQGLGQGDRIGNKCKTLKAVLRYTLNAQPYDAVSNPQPVPQEVIIMIGFVKQSPTSIPTATNINNLYQSGSTSSAPQGDLGDLIQPYNTDYWTIKKTIRHKIGNAAVEGSGSQLGKEYYSNNDYKFNAVRAVNLTNIYPKNLVWNDTGTFIQNAGLYIMIQAVRADGGVSAATTASVFFNYTLDLTYEDA